MFLSIINTDFKSPSRLHYSFVSDFIRAKIKTILIQHYRLFQHGKKICHCGQICNIQGHKCKDGWFFFFWLLNVWQLELEKRGQDRNLAEIKSIKVSFAYTIKSLKHWQQWIEVECVGDYYIKGKSCWNKEVQMKQFIQWRNCLLCTKLELHNGCALVPVIFKGDFQHCSLENSAREKDEIAETCYCIVLNFYLICQGWA